MQNPRHNTTLKVLYIMSRQFSIHGVCSLVSLALMLALCFLSSMQSLLVSFRCSFVAIDTLMRFVA